MSTIAAITNGSTAFIFFTLMIVVIFVGLFIAANR